MTDEIVIDPRDKKYYVEKPDASFSPQRNAAIIQEVHDDTRRFFAKLAKEQEQIQGERLDVLASFADYKLNRGGEKTFGDYTGRQLRTKIIGERLLSKVRTLSTVDKLQGRRLVQI